MALLSVAAGPGETRLATASVTRFPLMIFPTVVVLKPHCNPQNSEELISAFDQSHYGRVIAAQRFL